MQVYKAYFKIIRKRLPSILIYFAVYMVIVLVITAILGNQGAATFTQTRSKIAFFNDDTGSPLADGLKEYLSENASFVAIHDDSQSIEDALFFTNVQYVLRVPAGFTDGFLAGRKGVALQRMAVPASSDGMSLDLLIDRYLNMASLYAKNAPGMTADQIVKNVDRDLKNQSSVVMNTYGRAASTDSLTYYFQYLAYSILAVMIMGVMSFMMTFNDTDLINRNLCSPMKQSRMNLQIILGNASFAVGIWVMMCAAVFLTYGKARLDASSALLCINALALTVVGMSIGFLAGKFVRNPGVQNAITNVVALGVSFISGVFVPQELLGQTVLNISQFTPGYWYVKAINDIKGMLGFSLQSALPVLYSILIQVGFAAAIFILGMVISKQVKLKREI